MAEDSASSRNEELRQKLNNYNYDEEGNYIGPPRDPSDETINIPPDFMRQLIDTHHQLEDERRRAAELDEKSQRLRSQLQEAQEVAAELSRKNADLERMVEEAEGEFNESKELIRLETSDIQDTLREAMKLLSTLFFNLKGNKSEVAQRGYDGVGMIAYREKTDQGRRLYDLNTVFPFIFFNESKTLWINPDKGKYALFNDDGSLSVYEGGKVERNAKGIPILKDHGEVNWTIMPEDFNTELRNLQDEKINNMPVAELLNYLPVSAKVLDQLIEQNSQVEDMIKLRDEAAAAVDKLEKLGVQHGGFLLDVYKMLGLHRDTGSVPKSAVDVFREIMEKLTPEGKHDILNKTLDRFNQLAQNYEALKDSSQREAGIVIDNSLQIFDELGLSLDDVEGKPSIEEVRKWPGGKFVDVALRQPLLAKIEYYTQELKKLQYIKDEGHVALKHERDNLLNERDDLKEKRNLLLDKIEELRIKCAGYESNEAGTQTEIRDLKGLIETLTREKNAMDAAKEATVQGKAEEGTQAINFNSALEYINTTADTLADKLSSILTEIRAGSWDRRYEGIRGSLQQLLDNKSINALMRFCKVASLYNQTMTVINENEHEYINREYDFIKNNLKGGTADLERMLAKLSRRLERYNRIKAKIAEIKAKLPYQLEETAKATKAKVESQRSHLTTIRQVKRKTRITKGAEPEDSQTEIELERKISQIEKGGEKIFLMMAGESIADYRQGLRQVYEKCSGEKGIIQTLNEIMAEKNEIGDALVDAGASFGRTRHKGVKQIEHKRKQAKKLQFEQLHKKISNMYEEAIKYSKKINDDERLNEYLTQNQFSISGKVRRMVKLQFGKRSPISKETRRIYGTDLMQGITDSDNNILALQFRAAVNEATAEVERIYHRMSDLGRKYNRLFSVLRDWGYSEMGPEAALNEINRLITKVQAMESDFKNAEAEVKEGNQELTLDSVFEKIETISGKIDEGKKICKTRSEIHTLKARIEESVNSTLRMNLDYQRMAYLIADFARYAA